MLHTVSVCVSEAGGLRKLWTLGELLPSPFETRAGMGRQATELKRDNVRRNLIGSLLGLTAFGVVACEEQSPTSLDDSLLPQEPITVELRIPWEDFASNLEVIGGFGAPVELGTGILAKSFAGMLDARTILRFQAYPTEWEVRDTTGTTRTDSDLTFIGGRVVALLDTIASTNEESVLLGLGATQHEWDVRTVTWTAAVDTINDQRSWPEAGAGPVAPLATAEWDPTAGDSVWFELDSAQIAAWADASDESRGARIELLTAGERVEVAAVILRLNTRPSLNPDSTFFLDVRREGISFVYNPFPEPPPDGIRIGGTPAWRTILDVRMPAQLTGPPTVCAVVQCPVALRASELNYAALVFRTSRTEAAFQPTDTVGIDARPVLSRETLPKAPLGASVLGLAGRLIGPEFFGDQAEQDVEIPITTFARNLLTGADEAGLEPSETLALLSLLEPFSIAFASFHGPGSEGAPFLKLIVTIGRSVELP